MTQPYIILKEKYIPSKWRAWRIGKDLTKFTQQLGLIPLNDTKIKRNPGAAWSDEKTHAEVRMTAVPGSEGTQWHQDGDTSPGARMDHGLVIWANRTPTELFIDNKIYQSESFEVILVRNLAGMHRRPANAPARRFMFRQRVELPKGKYAL